MEKHYDLIVIGRGGREAIWRLFMRRRRENERAVIERSHVGARV